MRNRNKHHTLGVVAQSTLSNQHNPCSCARSDEKGFGFLRFGEENFCLFAAVMLLLVSKEGDVYIFQRGLHKGIWKCGNLVGYQQQR